MFPREEERQDSCKDDSISFIISITIINSSMSSTWSSILISVSTWEMGLRKWAGMICSDEIFFGVSAHFPVMITIAGSLIQDAFVIAIQK